MTVKELFGRIKDELSYTNPDKMKARVLIIDHNQNIKEIIRVDFVPEKNAVIIEVDE